jgi:serine protein kinase
MVRAPALQQERYGVDELARASDYFKAAAAGSDVGRRLLLLRATSAAVHAGVRPSAGWRNTGRTDAGALAIQGRRCTSRRST